MKKLIAGTMVALSILAMTGCSKNSNNGESKWYYYSATEHRQGDKLISSRYEVNYYILRVKYSSNCLEMQWQEDYGGKTTTEVFKGCKSGDKYYIVTTNIINKDHITDSNSWFIVSKENIKIVENREDEIITSIFKPQLVAI